MNEPTTKILIVDDHQMFIDGIKTLLKKVDEIAIIGEALNGKQAAEWMQHNKVDLVITDIEMPVMNGIELTKHIKNNYPDTGVLVLTMYNERGIVEEIAEAEAEGYILKNTGKAELINAIQRIRNGSSFYSNEVIDILNNSTQQRIIQQNNTKELSDREKEIIALICNELTTDEIASKLFISPLTVETHRKNITRKLHTKSIVGLIKFAIANGIA